MPERAEERNALEKDWHETYDTEPVDERDFVMDPEALAAEFEGVIVEGKRTLPFTAGNSCRPRPGIEIPGGKATRS